MAGRKRPPRQKAPREREIPRAARKLGPRVWIAFGLSAIAVVFVRTAWVCDDAYITYRVIDNFLHGYGLTWNVSERVQAYTHPLWLFINIPFQAIARDPYGPGIILSIVVSVAALAVFAFKVARSNTTAILGLLILVMSRAFVDYSTSGLENPLTHLWLAQFLAIWLMKPHDARGFLLLCITTSLGLLTRADFILLVVPALVYTMTRLPWRVAVKAALLGFSPFIAWEMFSLIYYGLLVPNTAYAKLNTGIQRSELVQQGFYYLRESLRHDPLTLIAIVGGMVAPIVARRMEEMLFAAGAAAYLIYIVWIGGDFMSGRFLTPPLFLAVAILSRLRIERVRVWAPVAAAVVAIGCVGSPPTITSGRGFGTTTRPMFHGIADERGFYFQQTGLFRADGTRGVDRHPKAIDGLESRAQGWHARLGGMNGILGYYSGPQAHILDGFALADPLLSRLPERGIRWRVGHFVREVPSGYMNSVVNKRNEIQDARLRKFYDAVRAVTRGKVFDSGRAAVIWQLNTGGFDPLLKPFFEAHRLQEEAVRHLAAGHADACIAAAARATKLDPRRAAAWYLLSRGCRQDGDLDSARAAAVQAATILPSEFRAELLAVGVAYEESGNTDAATSVYEQLLAADAEDADARRRLDALRGGEADR